MRRAFVTVIAVVLAAGCSGPEKALTPEEQVKANVRGVLGLVTPEGWLDLNDRRLREGHQGLPGVRGGLQAADDDARRVAALKETPGDTRITRIKMDLLDAKAAAAKSAATK